MSEAAKHGANSLHVTFSTDSIISSSLPWKVTNGQASHWPNTVLNPAYFISGPHIENACSCEFVLHATFPTSLCLFWQEDVQQLTCLQKHGSSRNTRLALAHLVLVTIKREGKPGQDSLIMFLIIMHTAGVSNISLFVTIHECLIEETIHEKPACIMWRTWLSLKRQLRVSEIKLLRRAPLKDAAAGCLVVFP